MRIFVLIAVSVTVLAATVPLKTFLQIPYGLESATNISQKTQDIAQYFSNQKGKLPQKGELVEVSVPGVLTQISYASLYCDKMVLSDSKLAPSARWVHKQVAFDQKATLWSESVWTSLFQEYSEIFWQRPLADDELVILNSEVPGLARTFPDEVAQNRNVLATLCSIFAGSFGFLLM